MDSVEKFVDQVERLQAMFGLRGSIYFILGCVFLAVVWWEIKRRRERDAYYEAKAAMQQTIDRMAGEIRYMRLQHLTEVLKMPMEKAERIIGGPKVENAPGLKQYKDTVRDKQLARRRGR